MLCRGFSFRFDTVTGEKLQTVTEFKRLAQIKTFHSFEDDFHRELTKKRKYKYPIRRFLCYACRDLLKI